MRALALLFAASIAVAAPFRVEPETVAQGGVVRVESAEPATAARLGKKSVPMYRQNDGMYLGLMPVSANHKPGTYELGILNDKTVVHTRPLTVLDGGFPEQNIRLRRSLTRLRPSPGEMEAVGSLRRTASESRFWDEPFAKPVPGCMTSPFGVRRLHNGKRTGNYHGGIDQRGAEGVAVRAFASGVVRIVQPFNIHGHTVGIDHGQGVTSLYLHLSRFAVDEGMKIEKGDVIGYVGSTGRSTAPHLHWTVAVNGVSVNPAQWVAFEPCAPNTPPPKKKRTTRRKRK